MMFEAWGRLLRNTEVFLLKGVFNSKLDMVSMNMYHLDADLVICFLKNEGNKPFIKFNLFFSDAVFQN